MAAGVEPLRSRALEVGLALLAGSILTTLLFPGAVLGSDILVERDNLFVSAPLHAYGADRLRAGEVPLWYPFDGLGEPFWATPFAAMLHPSTLLYLVLPTFTALSVSILLCYPLAVLGVVLLARNFGASLSGALAGGLVYAASGYLVCISNNLPYILGATALPWAIFGLLRAAKNPSARTAVSTVLLFDLVVFAGDAETFAMAAVVGLGVGWVLFGREALPLVIALLLLATLGAAAQALPSSLAVAAADAHGWTEYQAETWSVHPLRFVEMALGPLFSLRSTFMGDASLARGLLDSDMDALWSRSLFIGLPALVLAALGAWRHRRRPITRLLIGIQVVLGLLVMGKHTPIYGLAFHWLPVWRVFRYPVKLMPFIILLIALGTVAGYEAMGEPAECRASFRAWGSAAVACALALVAELLTGTWSGGLLRHAWPTMPAAIQDELHTRLLAWTMVAFVSSAALALAVVRSPPRARALAGLLAVGIPLAAHAPMSTSSRELAETPSPLAIKARETGAGLGVGRVANQSMSSVYISDRPLEDLLDPAIAAARVGMTPDTAELDGLESAVGYLPLASSRAIDLQSDSVRWLNAYSGMLGTTHVVVGPSERRLLGPGFEALAELPPLELTLLRNTHARPRAYLANPICVSDRIAAESRMTTDLRPDEAVVECAHALPLAPGEPGDAHISRYEPERVEVQIDARRDAVLVLNDAYYPGWSATLDGKPVEIWPANVAVRGVPVPPGSHQVAFTYHAPGLVLGLALTALSWLLVLLIPWSRLALTPT